MTLYHKQSEVSAYSMGPLGTLKLVSYFCLTLRMTNSWIFQGLQPPVVYCAKHQYNNIFVRGNYSTSIRPCMEASTTWDNNTVKITKEFYIWYLRELWYKVIDQIWWTLIVALFSRLEQSVALLYKHWYDSFINSFRESPFCFTALPSPKG